MSSIILGASGFPASKAVQFVNNFSAVVTALNISSTDNYDENDSIVLTADTEIDIINVTGSGILHWLMFDWQTATSSYEFEVKVYVNGAEIAAKTKTGANLTANQITSCIGWPIVQLAGGGSDQLEPSPVYYNQSLRVTVTGVSVSETVKPVYSLSQFE